MGRIISGTWKVNGKTVRYQSQIANLPKGIFSPKEISDLHGHFVSIWYSNESDTASLNLRVLIGYENGISKIERYNFIAKMKDSDVLDNDVSIYVLCMKVEQEEEYDEFHDVLMQVLNVTKLRDYTHVNPELN